MEKRDGSGATTSGVVATVSNGGAFSPSGGTLTHRGDGLWEYVSSGGEWNAEEVHVKFTEAGSVTQWASAYPDGKIVSGLNDFNAAADAVANVTTTTNNSDMRGTENANTIVPDNTQGAAVISHGDGAGAWGAIADVSALALETSVQTIITTGSTGPWTTANVAGLSTFNPATDTVANVTLVQTTTNNSDMRGTENALLAASAPTNFGDLTITATSGLVALSSVQTFNNAGQTTVQPADVKAWQGFTIPGSVMIENDAGDGRWTTQALEQGPGGGGGTDVNVISILGTAITESVGGQSAAGFSFYWDVSTPSKTMNDVGVAGSGLSQQDVADAMRLTPAGSVLSGSVDEQLGDLSDNTYQKWTYIDPVSGIAGGDGSPGNPVDNMTNAVALGKSDWYRYVVKWSLAINIGTAIVPADSVIDLAGGILTDIDVPTLGNNVKFTSSTLDGFIRWSTTTLSTHYFENLSLGPFLAHTLSLTNGEFTNCRLWSNTQDVVIVLTGTGTASSIFRRCQLGRPGQLLAIAFPASGTASVRFMDCTGEVEIRSMLAPNDCAFYGVGKMTIAATCTGGTITIGQDIGAYESDGVTPWDRSNTTNRPTVTILESTWLADGRTVTGGTIDINNDMRGTENANTIVPDNTQGAAVISHGDGAGAWGAIANVSALALETSVQAVITTGGTGPWTTGSGGGGGDITSIMGTALTEVSAGQLAAGFSFYWDVSTPSKTMNDVGVAGSGLSQQDVADAMRLTPAGSVLSGSVDEQLGHIISTGGDGPWTTGSGGGGGGYPNIIDVRLGTIFGSSSELTGVCRVPPVGKVELDYLYDANDLLTGTLDPGDHPAESDVRVSVVYASGAMVGNIELPVETDVRSPVMYGAAGVEKTGILEVTSSAQDAPTVRFSFTQGDDVTIPIDNPQGIDLTGATEITLTIARDRSPYEALLKADGVANGTGPVVYVNLTADQSDIASGTWRFDLRARLASEEIRTINRGWCEVALAYSTPEPVVP